MNPSRGAVEELPGAPEFGAGEAPDGGFKVPGRSRNEADTGGSGRARARAV